MKFLFIEAAAPGQIYRAAPMSLLYAIGVFAGRVIDGKVPGVGPQDLKVVQPNHLVDIEEFLEQDLRVVTVSATTYSAGFAREVARLVKKRIRDAWVFVGGSHFDGLFAHFEGDSTQLEPYMDSDIDVVISGNAEYLLACLLTAAMTNSSQQLGNVIELECVSPLSRGASEVAIWARQNGHLLIRRLPPNLTDLEEQPIPPRWLLDAESESQFDIFKDEDGVKLRTAQVLTYRGCLFAQNAQSACSFCFAANVFRKSQIERTIAEIRVLSEQGYRAIFFDDAIFTSKSRERKRELAKLTEALLTLPFEAIGFQTRADYLDEEVLDLLTQVPVTWYCSLGLESTAPNILKAMRKHQQLSDIVRAMKLLASRNINIGIYLLFGALGELNDRCITPETALTARKTLEFVALQRDIGIPIVSVLPGLSMILPGTRDALRYAKSTSQGNPALVFDLVYSGAPWNRFEGGMGMHAPGVDMTLVSEIDLIGEQLLGDLWPSRDP